MYGRVAIRKIGGKLIEFQSGDAKLGTLTQNAIRAGVPANDIIEKYVTLQEYKTIMAAVPAPVRVKTDVEKLVDYGKLQGWI